MDPVTAILMLTKTISDASLLISTITEGGDQAPTEEELSALVVETEATMSRWNALVAKAKGEGG